MAMEHAAAPLADVAVAAGVVDGVPAEHVLDGCPVALAHHRLRRLALPNMMRIGPQARGFLHWCHHHP
eukprot:1314363-Rhodomonas_salina.1